MRVTNRMQTNKSIKEMSDSLEQLYELQKKASTGKKYAKSSDNPSVVAEGMRLRSSLKSLESYTNTINTTKVWMEETDFALQNIEKVLADAQQIILKGLDDSYSASERKVMGIEINGIIDQVLELANSTDQGRFIFSGYMTQTKPFEMSTTTLTVEATVDSDGNALPAPPPAHPTVDYMVDTVVYNGDFNTMNRSIAPNETVNVNVNGGVAFLDSTRGGQVFDPNVEDVFATLIRVRDYLMGEDYLKVHADNAGTAVPGDDPSVNVPPNDVLARSVLATAYTKLQDVTESITISMTANGARIKNLNTSLERSENATLEIESLLSQNEDVNWAEIISLINSQEMVYQTSIDVSGRIGSMMNLFDSWR